MAQQMAPLLPARYVVRRAIWANAPHGQHAGNKGGTERPNVREELSHHPRGELPAILLIEKHHRPGGYALLASHKAKVLRCGCLDTHL